MKRFQCITKSLLDSFLMTMSRFQKDPLKSVYQLNDKESFKIITHNKKPVDSRFYLFTLEELNEETEIQLPCALMVVGIPEFLTFQQTACISFCKELCQRKKIPHVFIQKDTESRDESYQFLFSELLKNN